MNDIAQRKIKYSNIAKIEIANQMNIKINYNEIITIINVLSNIGLCKKILIGL